MIAALSGMRITTVPNQAGHCASVPGRPSMSLRLGRGTDDGWLHRLGALRDYRNIALILPKLCFFAGRGSDRNGSQLM